VTNLAILIGNLAIVVGFAHFFSWWYFKSEVSFITKSGVLLLEKWWYLPFVSTSHRILVVLSVINSYYITQFHSFIFSSLFPVSFNTLFGCPLSVFTFLLLKFINGKI